MMADILLADCSGQGWLVRGEQYIDDLLANTLPAFVTVEVVTCESKPALDALRQRCAGEWDTESTMWLIHPAIVNRARGQAGSLSATFEAWSASLNPAALASVRTAAQSIVANPAKVLALVRHVAADAPAMAGALADLRSGLLEEQLAVFGVPADRIVRETSADGPPDQIALMIREPDA